MSKLSRPNGVNSVKLVTVIETKLIRGKGTNQDPCRTVYQYWNSDGELLAENDTIIMHALHAIEEENIPEKEN